MNVIYGTIRLIERDDESVLAWAREPWACVVFNLHVDHSPEGLGKAQRDFRRLIERAAAVRRQLLPDVSPLGDARPGRTMPSADARVPRAKAGVRPARGVHERLVHAPRTPAGAGGDTPYRERTSCRTRGAVSAARYAREASAPTACATGEHAAL